MKVLMINGSPHENGCTMTALREVAAELVRHGAKQIILGHLSKENNYPELAMKCCELALRQSGIVPFEDVEIIVAARDGCTGIWVLHHAHGRQAVHRLHRREHVAGAA